MAFAAPAWTRIRATDRWRRHGRSPIESFGDAVGVARMRRVRVGDDYRAVGGHLAPVPIGRKPPCARVQDHERHIGCRALYSTSFGYVSLAHWLALA